MAERPIERCCVCDDPTGKLGFGDGSLYTESGNGPFCESCYPVANYMDEKSRSSVAAMTAEKEKAEGELRRARDAFHNFRYGSFVNGRSVNAWKLAEAVEAVFKDYFAKAQ